MSPDFLDRIDAWQKAGRTPERTSSFLRAPTAPTADEVDDVNSIFVTNAKVISNTSNTTNPVTNGPPKSEDLENKKNVEVISSDSGSSSVDVKPAETIWRSDDPHDGCGCPVSAALNSMKEEAEAADLYNKRANTVEDEHAREVYRDIAKEEMVHMGEAAELLSEADPELAAEVPKGMQEAKGDGEPTEEWKPDIDKAVSDRQ